VSSFGLTIWVYQLTGSATALSLLGFFFFTPTLTISLLSGLFRLIKLKTGFFPRQNASPQAVRLVTASAQPARAWQAAMPAQA
jgi:hypothetical protein